MSSAKQSAIWDLQLWQTLLPKLGHEASECEDVIAANPESGRFAVADGATEAFDARRWAERLAQHWVLTDATLAPEAFRSWVAGEGRELQDTWSGLSLSWYAEEKARSGSFAAFVGVEFDLKTEKPSWTAVALGDACLMHCRRGAMLQSLPLSKSQSFSTTPVLVASEASLHDSSMKAVVTGSGSCERGDVLWLMSDAAAAWFLQRQELRDFDAANLLATKSKEELTKFFDEERMAGRIRNDDLAVVRLEVQRRVS